MNTPAARAVIALKAFAPLSLTSNATLEAEAVISQRRHEAQHPAKYPPLPPNATPFERAQERAKFERRTRETHVPLAHANFIHNLRPLSREVLVTLSDHFLDMKEKMRELIELIKDLTGGRESEVGILLSTPRHIMLNSNSLFNALQPALGANEHETPEFTDEEEGSGSEHEVDENELAAAAANINLGAGAGAA